MGMSLSLPGCCISDTHKCGLNASTMGCIERTAIGAATMGNFQAISCGLGDGATSPVTSSLQYFKQDYLDYIEGRTAPRLRSAELVGAH